MSRDPQPRPLNVAATRAAFAAGTLSAVPDDAPHRNAEGNVIVTQADGANGDGMAHREPVAYDSPAERERTRRSRLTRWQERRL